MDNFVGASVRSLLHLIVYGEKHCQMYMGPEGRVQGAKGYFGSQIMIVSFNIYDARQKQYGHLGCCLS